MKKKYYDLLSIGNKSLADYDARINTDNYFEFHEYSKDAYEKKFEEIREEDAKFLYETYEINKEEEFEDE